MDLVDEIRPNGRLLSGEFDSRDAPRFKAFEHPRHVSTQLTHGPQALFVLFDLVGLGTVHVVPVSRAHDGHLGDGKELLNVIEGHGGSSATGGCDGGCRFEAEGILYTIAAAGVKEAIHKTKEGSARVRIVHRSSEHKAVSIECQLAELVNLVVKDALSKLVAGFAGNASTDGFGAEPIDLAFDSFSFERACHFLERSIRATVFVRTSVDQ